MKLLKYITCILLVVSCGIGQASNQAESMCTCPTTGGGETNPGSGGLSASCKHICGADVQGGADTGPKVDIIWIPGTGY